MSINEQQTRDLCSICYGRIVDQQRRQYPIADQEARRLLEWRCFSEEEHANSNKVTVILRNGVLFEANPTPRPVMPDHHLNQVHLSCIITVHRLTT